MQRLDTTCIQIVEKLTSPQLNPDEKAELQKRLAARQEKLLPMYHQVAIQFADLHDTPGRMEEMGVITVSVKSCGVGNILIDNNGNINVRTFLLKHICFKNADTEISMFKVAHKENC